jgi:hypothetical protein
MSLFIFKKFAKEVLYLFSFVISLISILNLIFRVNFKNKTVFLQPEGGFAHTILSPEVLKRIYNSQDWILIFGYHARRHNYLTKNFYENNFYWLNFGKLESINLIKDSYKDLAFSILELYLKFKKIDFSYYVKFIDSYDNFDQSKIDKKFNKENMLMHEYNAYKIFLKKNIFVKENFFNESQKKYFINLNNKKKCGFAFKKRSNHLYTDQRSTDNLENYKKSFFTLVEMGYEIHIYGDKLEIIPKWFNDIEKNIFYLNKSKENRDQYNIRCGLTCDFYIGPSSGASSWKYIFHKKPQLIIDSYPLGWGFFNSVISFKIIENYVDKKSLDEILNDKIYILEKSPYKSRNTNEEEKNLIISNFVKNIDMIQSEIIDPKDLNLSKDHPLLWSNSYISKSWYDIQKNIL